MPLLCRSAGYVPIYVFSGRALDCCFHFWTLSSADEIYWSCIKGMWAVTVLMLYIHPRRLYCALVPMRCQCSKFTGSRPSACCISTWCFSCLIAPLCWALLFPPEGEGSDHAFFPCPSRQLLSIWELSWNKTGTSEYLKLINRMSVHVWDSSVVFFPIDFEGLGFRLLNSSLKLN